MRRYWKKLITIMVLMGLCLCVWWLFMVLFFHESIPLVLIFVVTFIILIGLGALHIKMIGGWK